MLCALAYEEIVGGGTASETVRLADQALANDELLHVEGPACMPMYRAVVALLVCDELERGAATLTLAIGEARRLASPTAFVWASAWRGCANLRLGRLLDAEADARAALESGDQYLSGYGQNMARIWLADSLTEQGRLKEARNVLSEVREAGPPSLVTLRCSTRVRDFTSRAASTTRQPRLRAPPQPREPTASLVEWRRPATGMLGYRLAGARALMGLGDLDGARALINEELPLAKAFGTHRAIGMTLHVAGLLEHGETRIQTLKRATEELSQCQSRVEYAKALCDYGAALRRANRRSAARAPLQAALAIARDARAEPLRDRAAQELKATGARVSRPALTGVDALTASEHRIASMAAAGMRNRDIAQALFVTIKTVETHLGHIYDKLNLTGRTQLAAALGDRTTSAESAPDARLARPARLRR